MNKPCVFFDRDGIVNQSPGPGYVERLEAFHMLPEFIEAARIAAERGYETVIVTNQRGVALGRMSRQTVDRIHEHLKKILAREGIRLLDIMVCTADDDRDPNRKPNPGMIMEAAEKHGLDLARSWMVGDNEKDVEAGRRAGCRTILVDNTTRPTRADQRVENMGELVNYLKKSL